MSPELVHRQTGVALEILEKAVVFLRGNGPRFETGAPGLVFDVHDGGTLDVVCGGEAEPAVAYVRRVGGVVEVPVWWSGPERVVGVAP